MCGCVDTGAMGTFRDYSVARARLVQVPSRTQRACSGESNCTACPQLEPGRIRRASAQKSQRIVICRSHSKGGARGSERGTVVCAYVWGASAAEHAYPFLVRTVIRKLAGARPIEAGVAIGPGAGPRVPASCSRSCAGRPAHERRHQARSKERARSVARVVKYRACATPCLCLAVTQ